MGKLHLRNKKVTKNCRQNLFWCFLGLPSPIIYEITRHCHSLDENSQENFACSEAFRWACSPHLKHFCNEQIDRKLTQHFASANFSLVNRTQEVLSSSYLEMDLHWTPLLRASLSQTDAFSWKTRKGFDGNKRNMDSIKDDAACHWTQAHRDLGTSLRSESTKVLASGSQNF